MIRTALAAVAALALAACATTSRDADASRPPRASTGQRIAEDLPPAPPGAHAAMVQSALSMLGRPYRFGGADPGGFDCSGLVAYAASGAGIRLPRTAREQLAAGEPIARGEVRAGDLIFMHLTHKELHVAIALDRQRFIHAPSRGGYVRIDSLAAPPYADGFVGARRIIPDP